MIEIQISVSDVVIPHMLQDLIAWQRSTNAKSAPKLDTLLKCTLPKMHTHSHSTRNITCISIHYNIDSYNIILITIAISISYFFPVIPSTPDLSYPYMLLPISIPNH